MENIFIRKYEIIFKDMKGEMKEHNLHKDIDFDQFWSLLYLQHLVQ